MEPTFNAYVFYCLVLYHKDVAKGNSTMQVLDDQNYIKQYDSDDALGFAGQQPEQLGHDFGLRSATFTQPIQHVVFAGMGGSSLAAEFVRTWPVLPVPFVVVKDYTLPAFVNEHTLVICASYSGNTEETLAALDQAKEKNAQIVIIASGGKLLERAKVEGLTSAQVPHCPQPRTAVLYGYRATVEILVAAKLIPSTVIQELETLVSPPMTTLPSSWR